MKIPENIQYIEVYYDGRCNKCCAFHEWLSEQALVYPVHFFPYQSPRAEEWFRGLGCLDPERELIVRADDGSQYRAAEGWVLCLLSCSRYGKVARRLASPALLPFAGKVCHALAGRRRMLSKIFLHQKDEKVAVELHRMPGQKCDVDSRSTVPGRIPDGII